MPYDPMSLDAQSRCVCRDGEPVGDYLGWGWQRQARAELGNEETAGTGSAGVRLLYELTATWACGKRGQFYIISPETPTNMEQ